MEEKKKAKKPINKKDLPNKKSTTSKKVVTSKPAKKEATSKTTKKSAINTVAKKEVKKDAKKLENKITVESVKTKRKFNIIQWFNKLTIEQIAIWGTALVVLLLIVLILVSSRNSKLPNGDEVIVKVNGKKITAQELYNNLKNKNGRNYVIDTIDTYIIDKEYKTTSAIRESAKSTIESYKSTYGDNFKSFLSYNGLTSEAELESILIKNQKLTNVTKKFIKANLTAKEMEEYYNKSIVGDIKASHILIPFDNKKDATDEEKTANEAAAKAKAEALIIRIKNGEDFATLAKENSSDEGSKKDGGNLGYFNKGSMVEEFETAAYKLSLNEYTTTPVKTTYGYHIIMKTGEKKKPSYKTSKDIIIKNIVEEKTNNDPASAAMAMDNLRKKYDLKIYDKTIKTDYNQYLKESTQKTNNVK
ncbi:MAG: peptidylprolyl isomerase [Bacilli bacterium]